MRTPYWDWTEREGTEHYRRYAGTAPVHLLFAMRKAVDMLFAEGLENVFRRHRLLAEAVRRAVTVWAEGQVLGLNISEPSERSDTVTTVLVSGGEHDPISLQRYCKEKCGVVLGTGIGELQGAAFRIAHMGHVNAPMILGTLARDRGRAERARYPPRQRRHQGRDRVSRRKCKPVSAAQAFPVRHFWC